MVLGFSESLGLRVQGLGRHRGLGFDSTVIGPFGAL